MTGQARLLVVASAVHVAVVVALLVAIAVGAPVPLLVALVGAVVASIGWLLALHRLAEDAELLRPPVPLFEVPSDGGCARAAA